MTLPRRLPQGMSCHKTTTHFTRHNIPQGLLASHSVKPGVWGLLRVARGRIRYCVDDNPPFSEIVCDGETAVIPPETPHHVELLDPESTFFIEFCDPFPSMGLRRSHRLGRPALSDALRASLTEASGKPASAPSSIVNVRLRDITPLLTTQRTETAGDVRFAET